MAGFTTFTATAAPIAASNVDTDQIFPARFSSKNRADGNFGTYFLHDRRFDPSGVPITDFILNDPRLQDVGIIVAAANYGAGSGRPGAIFSHLDYGIRAIIAESYGPVFLSAAYKSGLLTIEVGPADAEALRARLLADLGSAVTIDLPAQTITAGDLRIDFAIDPFVKRIVAEGLSETDLTLSFSDLIDAFETNKRRTEPWLFKAREVG